MVYIVQFGIKRNDFTAILIPTGIDGTKMPVLNSRVCLTPIFDIADAVNLPL
jgi:hypothetical protein